MAVLCTTPGCGGTRVLNVTTQEINCANCGYTQKLQSRPLKEQPTEVEKNMDRKEKFISKSLDKKNTAIEIAGAKRDAVLIVTALINGSKEYLPGLKKPGGLKEELEHWARYWLNFDPSEEPEEQIKLPNKLF